MMLRFGRRLAATAIMRSLGPLVDHVSQKAGVRLCVWAHTLRGVRFDGLPVWIAPDVRLDCARTGFITIGDRACLSHEVMILTHDYSAAMIVARDGDPAVPSSATHEIVRHAPVVIGEGAFLGPRAIVLPGLTVGAWSVIAAGAVVTHDIPPETVWAGNPARQCSTVAELRRHRRADFVVQARRR